METFDDLMINLELLIQKVESYSRFVDCCIDANGNAINWNGLQWKGGY